MAGLCDLTPREMEILKLIVVGRTNKAIAAQLGIREKTVEFHLSHIYTKIDARTRVLAGIWAIQHGLDVEAKEIPSYYFIGDS